MSSINRRKFLVFSAQLPVGMFVAQRAFAQCVDPDELSDSVLEMRESMEYTADAADRSSVCGGCQFFKPRQPTDSCGYCEVLQGQVSATGHCVSWTKRS